MLKSLLFAPGNHARRVENALSLNVDAVILDLEDAVAVTEKVAARESVAAALRMPRKAAVYVRINDLSTVYAYGDLLAVIQEQVDGIVLPKIESVAQLGVAHWLISQIERERGLQPNAIDLMPIVETAVGFACLDDIARHASMLPRVRRFAFGAGDFTLDMDLTWTAEELELLFYRSQLLLASRAHRLEAPIDTVWTRLDDREGFARSAQRSRELGYQGKLCIHPDQCRTVNAIFTPSDAELARAHAVIEAFRRAEAAGSASIRFEGEFIDYPIVERARRIVNAARREPSGATPATNGSAISSSSINS